MNQHQPAPPIVWSFEHVNELKATLASVIINAQKETLEKKGKSSFTVALSGGSLPDMLSGLIGRPEVKWKYWQVFYADERIVPLDHPDSNHGLAKAKLFDRDPNKILPATLHSLDADLLEKLKNLSDPGEIAQVHEDLTDAYEAELIREFAQKDTARFPMFDLILLGIGPDGHTASLFPGHPLLAESDRWVRYIDDSPKPPPHRITFTYPVLNHASLVIFVASGGEKADVLHTILDKPEVGLPASRVRPVHPGKLYYFVNAAAAAKIETPVSRFTSEMVSRFEGDIRERSSSSGSSRTK